VGADEEDASDQQPQQPTLVLCQHSSY